MPALVSHTLYVHPDSDTLFSGEINAIVSFETARICVCFKSENTVVKLMVFNSNEKALSLLSDADLEPLTNEMTGKKKVTLLYQSTKETLIPAPLFDSNMVSSYINFNFTPDIEEAVLYDTIAGTDINQVFTISENIHKYINHIFPGIPIRNRKSVLAGLFLKSDVKGQRCCLNHRSGSCDVFIFKDDTLLLINTFIYKTAQDFIFYLLHTLKQLNMDTETLTLFLTGEIEKDSAVYNYLYKYIRFIKFPEKPESINFSSEDISYHYFYDIFSI